VHHLAEAALVDEKAACVNVGEVKHCES